ncbi:GrlR family regulatory protein [Xanthomonas axonopodis pv. cassiae]|uniref:T3SS negative regulator,GrlR n=1 Tax=Xanthomonas euvesicatoria TaxID=456327 RepID=A0AAW3U3Y5_XANEU|nr:GrlR family regulatory protein [Xanthomonas euvesicatoria]MBB4723379.1 hypothetical protein [Xanthomonas euvesicatoria]MBB4870109.1 hypothetical protein [Xanthomonas euvesicatoria]
MNGIYSVDFIVSDVSDWGDGIITIYNGLFSGGDRAYTYHGRLSDEGGELKGKVIVRKWSAVTTSVHPGLDNYELDVSGTIVDGQLNFRGAVAGMPDLEIVGHLRTEILI